MTPVVRRVVQLLVLTAVQAIVLLGCAGTLRWPAAWLYLGLYVAMLGVGVVVLVPQRSGVIEERSRGARGARPWDSVVTRLMAVTSITVLVVAGAQVVRIQAERGDVAVTSGPYRIVRHPGYVGMMTAMAGAVLLLGSPWAWIPALMYAAVMVVRTGLEDSTLIAELPGYPEYAGRTRFRLVPGDW